MSIMTSPASVELIKKVKEVAFLEGEFITRAGKPTSYYIDKYLMETRPEVLGPLTDELSQLMPDPGTYDRIAAPELGAVALAAMVSVKVNKPFIIVKKQSKDYGTQKLIEGHFEKGERVVVLEDILTTAGAALRACDIVEEVGLTVTGIVGVVNREEGAEANIEKAGYSMKALLTTTDLKNA
ncbi:orotate phosphoribosyltransferase [bacterium]|jgi:orotate phosphoribosyltransferase|nr:orotate phosphoribosyltransferase [bacterium]